MYSTFSHTFPTEAQGDKKFFLTVNRPAAGQETIFEGKINDDKAVPKFKMKKDGSGQWKIQATASKMPAWVLGLETAFGARIEEIAAR